MLPRTFGRPRLTAAVGYQHDVRPRPNEARDGADPSGFVPLPAPTGAAPYRVELADVTADPAGSLTVAVVGDTGGIVDAVPQRAVCAALGASLNVSGASLVYHVGDLVYFNGDASQWYPQFYEPNERLDVPVLGVPGNHDGDNSDDPAVPSLTAFVRNMCAASPAVTAEAGDSGRDAMTQPNVYWTLRANLATIVGLYTNVPSGGAVDATQAAWLAGELQEAPTDRPVVVALHHPPYSCDAYEGGSAAMGNVIDAAAVAAGRWPDLVLSGHVHNYQRFSRRIVQTGAPGGAKEIVYVVCGAGGYHNLHEMAADVTGYPWQTPDPDVVLRGAVDSLYGFLTVTVAEGVIHGSYTTVSRDGTVAAGADTF